MPFLPPTGVVEIGGTSAVVVELTRGIAWATPIAPDAMTPRLNADSAEIVIQDGVAAMALCSRWGSSLAARLVIISVKVRAGESDSPR